jgi:histidinol phosphatase-like PHP family hydrolase
VSGSAAWTPIDCHAHTTFSDGQLTPGALVERVRGRGVRPSVADHVSGDVALSLKSVDAVRAYLDALTPLDVARGAEFCWHDPLWREMPPELTERLTHRLGSLHAIELPGGSWVHMFQRHIPDGLTPEQYMDAHVATLELFARHMPVEILAHPTLLPLSYRTLPIEELWTEAREERAVTALKRAGIAFEVSNRYRPHQRFVDRARNAGVRLSLGSDGHTADQVGDLTLPLAMARAAGARDDELYDPFVHGKRPAAASNA